MLTVEYALWPHGVVVMITATKPKLMPWPDSSPARGVSGIRDSEDL